MKRRLIVMRHAKSSWSSGAQGDHERPLNERGRHDAPVLGALIAQRGWVPDRVISSDSMRTRETWDGLMEAMPSIEPRFTSSLYLAGLSAVRQVVSALDDDVGTALLLGHNPGFSLAASWLTGDEIELKTAYAAVMETEAKRWADGLKIGAWDLVEVLTPASK